MMRIPSSSAAGVREVRVPKAFYDKMPENSTMGVYQKAGLFDIPWHTVDDLHGKLSKR